MKPASFCAHKILWCHSFTNDFHISANCITLMASPCLLMKALCEQSANRTLDNVCGGSSCCDRLFKCSVTSLSNCIRFADFAQYFVAYLHQSIRCSTDTHYTSISCRIDQQKAKFLQKALLSKKLGLKTQKETAYSASANGTLQHFRRSLHHQQIWCTLLHPWTRTQRVRVTETTTQTHAQKITIRVINSKTNLCPQLYQIQKNFINHFTSAFSSVSVLLVCCSKNHCSISVWHKCTTK